MSGDGPVLSAGEIAAFHARGYAVVRGLVQPSELAECAATFEDYMSQRLKVEGKDYGEHTPGLMNVTAFTRYHALSGVFAAAERRSAALARQLYPISGALTPMRRDYEQLLRKLPSRPSALFPAHQDIAYWPRSASGSLDTRTLTVSIAVNAASEANGCLWVLPGSHASRALHNNGVLSKLAGSRPDAGGVLVLALTAEELSARAFLPLAPGDATLHEEWIVHGSEGNGSPESRDTLIFAHRSEAMVAIERGMGFHHSYNDGEAVLRAVRETVLP